MLNSQLQAAAFLNGYKLFYKSSLHLSFVTVNSLGRLMHNVLNASKVFLVVYATCIFSATISAEQIIYQWRDSNNVLHVSQLPPANVNYQTIILGSKNTNSTPADPPPLPAKTNAETDKNCTKAQENLHILQQDLPVYIDLEDGSKELLDTAKREQQRLLAEKQIQLYCNQPLKQ
jgi:hypothetical protein